VRWGTSLVNIKSGLIWAVFFPPPPYDIYGWFLPEDTSRDMGVRDEFKLGLSVALHLHTLTLLAEGLANLLSDPSKGEVA
jgi:hypothetical protein